jgi:hypothetical protein
LRDDGAGPEKITGEVELARVRRRGLEVFVLGVVSALVLTGLWLTAGR